MSRLAVLLVALLLANPVRAADDVTIDAPTRKAIDNALSFLAKEQERNGSWGRQNTAVTAFAIMAFLANGHVPDQGPYGAEVSRGVKFLTTVARDDGYLAGAGGGNMYSHGMATLCLSQVFGMTNNDEVRSVLKRAVDLIVRCQNREGGWRYEPVPRDADISATIMQMMALRGAKDSGLNVPDVTIKRAVAYINRCQASNGGYRYQPFGGEAGYARTAAGVCVLQLAGEYDAKPIQRAADWMDTHPFDPNHFWYGHYYAVHAYHQLGGKRWERYYNRMRTQLLATQARSGEWDRPSEGGAGAGRVIYQTAIGVLVLSVPADLLPIYQR